MEMRGRRRPAIAGPGMGLLSPPLLQLTDSTMQRRFIQEHYDGLPGALTAVTGLVTGHEALAGRLIQPQGFDVRGCKRILDAACGNGRYSRFLLRQADPDALITAFDLSPR